MKKYLKHDSAKKFKHSKMPPAIGDSNLRNVQTERQDNNLDPFGKPPMGWMPKDNIMSLVRKIDLEIQAKKTVGK